MRLSLFVPIAGLAFAAVLAPALLPAAAQHGHHAPTPAPNAPAPNAHPPYAGAQQRAIKALSEQQVADLRASRGMGLALAAELNGYPGPLHVLELADRLRLTPDQRARVQALFDAMKAEAAADGERVIDAERALDRAFAERSITAPRLVELTAAAGAAQATLRATHLKYHLATVEIVTPDQRQLYAELRGYR